MKSFFFYCCQLTLILTLSLSDNVKAQNKKDDQVKLYGQIKNTWTGEGLSGVNVYIESLKKGTTTDNQGKYELAINKGTFVVKFSRVDMDEEVHSIDLIADKEFNLEMREKVFVLEKVDVFSEREDANIKSLDIGKNILEVEKLNVLPTFLGETDIIKSLMLLPGVSTVGEGASGFNVRGGGVDQNLILQDGGLIFNPSHVFGFFSSFNPAVVNKATLYKSGLPAKYGGRLSSVLNVEIKEGDFKEYKASGSLGLISGKLAVEGPLIKDKLSFIVGTRMSYSDWLLKLAENPDVKNSSAAFQDFNAKLTYRIDVNDKVFYSGYLSHDNFALASDTAFSWTTSNHTLQWTHTFNDAIVLNTDATAGRYSYTIEDTEGINSFDIKSDILYNKARLDLLYEMSSSNRLNIGAEAISYQFRPGLQRPLAPESGVERIELEHEKSLESAVYLEDDYSFSEKFSVRAGLRFSMFRNTGKGSDFVYGPGPKNTENITDTVYYTNGERIAGYQGLEPRVNVNYNVTATSAIKLSYNRTRQYLHLITNTAAVTPTDLWKTSNKYIQPESADQYSLGYFRNFANNTIETSIEAYYKTADNIVDFQDGSKLLMNENIEADLLSGTSEAYGIEFFINKKFGKYTGWMSYTFSRIFHTIDGPYDEEKINLGRAYPANNDKPHAVSLAVNYKQSPVIEYGANFTYSSGRPATAPLSLYDVSNQTSIFNYSQRNQSRIPDYHRLDVSMTVHSKPKIDRKWNLSWTFAIYNLYARKNAYSIFYENQYGAPPKAYKLSVLGSIFPSIMVNFKF